MGSMNLDRVSARMLIAICLSSLQDLQTCIALVSLFLIVVKLQEIRTAGRDDHLLDLSFCLFDREIQRPNYGSPGKLCELHLLLMLE